MIEAHSSLSIDSNEGLFMTIVVSNSSKSTSVPIGYDGRTGKIPNCDTSTRSSAAADRTVVDADDAGEHSGAEGAAAERRALVAALGLSLGRAGRRRRRWTGLVFLGLGLGVLVAVLVSVAAGAHPIPIERIFALAADPSAPGLGREALVIGQIRLPRILACVLVGASLAVSGALMQGLFRNPLADPGLLGVSSGAALAAGATIVLGDRIFGRVAAEALPAAAFLGAISATLLLTLAGRRVGRTETAVVLLAGLAFAALANAALGFLVFVADDRELRDLSFWTLGSFGGVGWPKLAAALPLLLAPLIAAPFLAGAFDALAFGEAEAHHLGHPVERVKAAAIVATALGVGAAVALVGIVGFVGIVVPHAVRLAHGASHRTLLPASALSGALLVLVADLVARTAVAPAELPIGVLTALVGAPLFLHLVLARRGGTA
jgi:iron complex transport system permease protein